MQIDYSFLLFCLCTLPSLQAGLLYEVKSNFELFYGLEFTSHYFRSLIDPNNHVVVMTLYNSARNYIPIDNFLFA